jgi:hypothetical protein
MMHWLVTEFFELVPKSLDSKGLNWEALSVDDSVSLSEKKSVAQMDLKPVVTTELKSVGQMVVNWERCSGQNLDYWMVDRSV